MRKRYIRIFSPGKKKELRDVEARPNRADLPRRFIKIAVLVEGAGSFDGESPTGAFGRILALIGAIATYEEIRIEIEFDVVTGMSTRGIFHVIRIQAVQTVDAGYGNRFVSVGKIFDIAERSRRNKLVLRVNVAIEAK